MQQVKTKTTILVTGATGQQGGAVARQLLAQNIPFRALIPFPRNKCSK